MNSYNQNCAEKMSLYLSTKVPKYKELYKNDLKKKKVAFQSNNLNFTQLSTRSNNISECSSCHSSTIDTSAPGGICSCQSTKAFNDN